MSNLDQEQLVQRIVERMHQGYTLRDAIFLAIWSIPQLAAAITAGAAKEVFIDEQSNQG